MMTLGSSGLKLTLLWSIIYKYQRDLAAGRFILFPVLTVAVRQNESRKLKTRMKY